MLSGEQQQRGITIKGLVRVSLADGMEGKARGQFNGTSALHAETLKLCKG